MDLHRCLGFWFIVAFMLFFGCFSVGGPLGETGSLTVMTYGSFNTPEWVSDLGISSLRLGCSSSPAGCVEAYRYYLDNYTISLSIARDADLVVDYSLQYSNLSLSNPNLHEIGFDDFVGLYAGWVVNDSINASTLLDEVINGTKRYNPDLKFGITLYEDQITSPYISDSNLPGSLKEKVDYVHLYLHYRANGANYGAYVNQTRELFPNAQVIAGSYAYDRISYIKCSPNGTLYCTTSEELEYYNVSISIQAGMLKRGEVYGIEFYPAYFGMESSWPYWNNSVYCGSEREAECIDNTQKMRNAALNILYPSITFSGPTPDDGAEICGDNVSVEAESTEGTVTLDWNNSLVGWWLFNEVNGDPSTLFRDSSSHDRNVSCSGTACPVAVSGKFGDAFSFDGIDDCVNVSVPSADLSGDLSVEFWIRPSDVGSARVNPIDKAYWGEFAFTVETYGQLTYFHGQNKTNYTSFAVLPAGTVINDSWQHVVLTRDASSKVLRSYYNGASMNVKAYSLPPSQTSEPVLIGDGYMFPFKGLIDEVRIWGRVLSEGEVKASYDAGLYPLRANFSALSPGTYFYQAYVQDAYGYTASTEKRSLILTTTTTATSTTSTSTTSTTTSSTSTTSTTSTTSMTPTTTTPTSTIATLTTTTSTTSTTLRVPGDADGDGHVNYNDLLIIAYSYDTHSVSEQFDSRADFNSDGYVGYDDLLVLAENYVAA